MRFNLRLKFGIALAFIGLIPLIIFSVIFIYQVESSLELQSKNILENLAVDKGMDVERFISVGYMVARDVSDNSNLRSGSVDDSEKLEELNEVKDIYKFYDDITLLDLDGNVIVSTDYKFRGEWITKEWFVDAKKGNVVVSDVHTILYPTKTVMVYTAPVYNYSGNVNSIIAMQVSMDEVWKITGNFKIGDTGYAVLVDDKNRIISHPDSNRLYDYLTEDLLEKSNKELGSFKYSHEEKIYYIGYFTLTDDLSYKTKEWKIFIIQEQDEPFKIFYNLRLQIVFIELATLIIILVLALLFTNIITKPIKILRYGVEKISKGDLDYVVEINTRDEVNDLADDINQMTKSLKKSKKDLENSAKMLEIKVKERTSDLERANKKLEEQYDELKKFEKLTTGREMKMIELKKKIKELEDKIKKA